MILYYFATTLYVLVCLCLLLVILLQQGKGGDMASAFGGGSSQTAFGARGGATVLSKATAILAALFMLGALVLAVIGQRGPGSIVSGTPAPRPVQTPKPATPTGTPPPGRRGPGARGTAPATPATPTTPSPAAPAPAPKSDPEVAFLQKRRSSRSGVLRSSHGAGDAPPDSQFGVVIIQIQVLVVIV